MNKKMINIFTFIAIGLTIYLFLNFDIWDSFIRSHIEQLVGSNPRDIIATSFLASIVAFFLPIMFCLSPLFVVSFVAITTNVLEHEKGAVE